MPEGLPQLAPGDDDPHPLVECHPDRPDHPVGLLPGLIAIPDRELAALADRCPDASGIDLIDRLVAAIGRREQGAVEQDRPQMRRQNGCDLADDVFGRACQHRVGTFTKPAHADENRLDLVRREHQRRQVEASVEHVADAGLAAYGHALAH